MILSILASPPSSCLYVFSLHGRVLLCGRGPVNKKLSPMLNALSIKLQMHTFLDFCCLPLDWPSHPCKHEPTFCLHACLFNPSYVFGKATDLEITTGVKQRTKQYIHLPYSKLLEYIQSKCNAGAAVPTAGWHSSSKPLAPQTHQDCHWIIKLHGANPSVSPGLIS